MRINGIDEVIGKLIYENRLLSATFLIKALFESVNERITVFELKEIIGSGRYRDPILLREYLNILKKFVEKSFSRGIESLWIEDLLIAVGIVLLVLVVLSILPPYGDLIAIPAAAILIVVFIDSILCKWRLGKGIIVMEDITIGWAGH